MLDVQTYSNQPCSQVKSQIINACNVSKHKGYVVIHVHVHVHV